LEKCGAKAEESNNLFNQLEKETDKLIPDLELYIKEFLR
jgi:hypothetical protein